MEERLRAGFFHLRALGLCSVVSRHSDFVSACRGRLREPAPNIYPGSVAGVPSDPRVRQGGAAGRGVFACGLETHRCPRAVSLRRCDLERLRLPGQISPGWGVGQNSGKIALPLFFLLWFGSQEGKWKWKAAVLPA